MNEAQIRAVLDMAFAYLESKTSQPLLKILEVMLGNGLDAEIPDFLAYLQAHGFPVAGV